MSLTDTAHLQHTSSTEMAAPSVALNGVVSAMFPLLTRIAGSFIRLETRLEPADLLVSAEVEQIEQALLSLVVSACDAMPLGGTVVVSTRQWLLASPHSHLHGEVPPGRWGVLRVTDTGLRLDDTAVSRLTGGALRVSAPASITGTDLARVAAIVRRASGHIVVEDRGQVGTSIALCFPAIEPVARPSSPAEESPAILLVDRDAWVRTSTARVLKRAGYGVLQADHASAALELLRGVTGSCIKAMLVDVDLPGVEAESLTRAALREQEDLRVLYVGRARAGWNDDLLTKPFTAEELLRAVARKLEVPSA